MMKLHVLVLCVALVALSAGAWAATTYSWELNAGAGNYSVPISADDVINGMIGTVTPGTGFHGATPAPGEQWLTDGQLGSTLQSITNDFTKPLPALQITYTFAPQQLSEIRTFGGNNDARCFQDLDCEVLINGNWFMLVQGATTGDFYKANGGQWESSLIRISEVGGGPLSEGDMIGGVRLSFWAVTNTMDWFVPSDVAQGGSVINEIDVMPVPEPSSLLALATGVFGMAGFLLKRRSS